MTLSCCNDPRRQDVRAFRGRVGLDFVEVSADQLELHVYFLGKLPPEFGEDGPGLLRHLRIEGGTRIGDIGIVDVDPHPSDEPDVDDWLTVRLDRRGDHSRYRLRLLDIDGLDPMYASAEFSFKAGCPSDLDCAAVPACVEEPPSEPALSYLAKDYASFRRLIQDRLALVSPDWDPEHVPDLGVTLIELLAYAGDYLSYYQDAVATEAYLDTARQRISVRRHARLVDYRLHEGCNARAWVAVETSQDLDVAVADIIFLSGIAADAPVPPLLGDEAMRTLASDPYHRYDSFLPLTGGDAGLIALRSAHNRIAFYDWGRDDCCLPRGATTAVLRDAWAQSQGEARALELKAGDVLLLKEVLGPRSGLEADADPSHVRPVRLTRVEAIEDTLYPTGPDDPRPIPLLRVEWHSDDALPFALCLSALGPAPNCARLHDVSMALGNVVLADHGRRAGPLDLGTVPDAHGEAECECEGQPSELVQRPGRFHWHLPDAPLTHRTQVPAANRAASASLDQDPREALPALRLDDDEGAVWTPVFDLLGSGDEDRHVVVEMDNQGLAHLRFGDDDLGKRPEPGRRFAARYRLGNGSAGNVGAHGINRVHLRGEWSGLQLRVDNPLSARGGTDPEPLAQARLLAPGAFRKQRLRAITADDYAHLAERDLRVQRAAGELVWTGSWYEADVALDPYGRVPADAELIGDVQTALHRVRRMGHDLHVETAVYVPIELGLEVCALPGYERGAIKAALLEHFGSGRRRDGQPGYFHPDRLSFGHSLRASALVAEAMAVTGVECARVIRLQRLFAAANRELEDGILRLGAHEIARLDNDPNYPEHGKLSIFVGGGR
ncbi:hypothetical protein GLA29479_1799 [Lysobacter antibioticus]|uniref:putative baseplate assembly protein n=1 Tax=Lysobacter antibioticus TaxID=84531 RepID=UPI000717090A|nr:putative baseplate assembly protein [Lysobacter antibioticus]ALN62673.1 hypothetical protein GLA29479_1799 [Lysobacter antibioticus]